MIEQLPDDPIPDGAVRVDIDTDANIARVYFATDPEGIQELDQQLGQLKMQARGNVKKLASERITSGFSSMVTGSEVRFRAKEEDQRNIISAAQAGINALLKTVDGDRVSVNQGLMLQVSKDMANDRESVLAEMEGRYAEIELATSEADLETIIDRVWA